MSGYTGWDKSRFTFVSTWTTNFILELLFNNYCIIFHRNNCKPTLATPWIQRVSRYILAYGKTLLYILFFSLYKIKGYMSNVKNVFILGIFTPMRKSKILYFTLFYFYGFPRIGV